MSSSAEAFITGKFGSGLNRVENRRSTIRSNVSERNESTYWNGSEILRDACLLSPSSHDDEELVVKRVRLGPL